MQSTMGVAPAEKRMNQGQPLDANILSRMVTSSGTGAGSMPIRVATMSDFRRSLDSTNSMPQAPSPAHNQASFGLMRRPPQSKNRLQMYSNRVGHPGPSPIMNQRVASNHTVTSGPAVNPMLRLLEERMAAQAAAKANMPDTSNMAVMTTSVPGQGGESSQPKSATPLEAAALQASINKWSRFGDQSHVPNNGNSAQAAAKISEHTGGFTAAMETVFEKSSPVLSAAGSTQHLGSPSLSSVSPRTSYDQAQQQNVNVQTLDANQKERLLQMMAMQAAAQRSPALQPAQGNQVLMAGRPVTGRRSSDMTSERRAQHQMGQVGQASPCFPNVASTPNVQNHMNRNAFSFAEVDRLRRTNQSIQIRQQLAMQERSNEQFYLQQRNLAVCALQNGQVLPSPESRNRMQSNMLNGMQQPQSEVKGGLLQGEVASGLKPSDSSHSIRKRSSWKLSDAYDDDDDDSTTRSFSTADPSIVSNSSSYSNKIHRSKSHASARSALLGSMENLRIKSPFPSNVFTGSTRNQSFSSGLNGMSISKKNQSFCSGLHMNSGQSSSTGSGSCTRPKSSLKRNSASGTWVKSMLSADASTSQPAINHISVQISRDHSVIQANPCPAKTVPTACTSQINIMSAVPDRIKYQNVKVDTKPIDIIKNALSSRGVASDTKSSLEMKEGFFFKYTEENLCGYCQEAVDAIRSNDVEILRKLSEGGTNLQCANRFGESLIHLACRRSHRDVVSFLINEGGVSLRVRDDYGRTPMHDACWRAEVDLELIDMLLDREPELLMLNDKRGHTPLDYARREHWGLLVPFLLERTDKFRPV